MRGLIVVGLSVLALGCGSAKDRDPDFTGGVVHIENKLEGSVCSGSLIAANAVLTARHCVAKTSDGTTCSERKFGNNVEPQRLNVSFTKRDAYDLRLDDRRRERSDVRLVLTPETESDTVCGTDMAVLILSRHISAETAVPLEVRYEPVAESHEAVQLIGFGTTGDNNLRERTGSWGLIDCRGTSCERTLTLAEWQANPYGCFGDSGGPLLDNDRKVLGVATGMRPPTENARCSDVMVATATSYYANFIKEALDIASTL